MGQGTGNANSVLKISGGTLGGSGSLRLAGPINWTGGTITNTVQCAGGSISGSATKTLRYGCLINAGLLTFSGGYLELYNSATISNLSAGTFDITADCDISYYSTSSGPIYNAGILRKSAGTGISLVGAPCYNTGTIEAQIGTLRLDNGSQYGGVVLVRSNAVLSFYGGSHDFAPGATVGGDGTIECIGSAVLNLNTDLTAGVLAVKGGRLSGSGTITADRLIWETGIIECTVRCRGGEILTGSANSPKLLGGRLINSGLLTGGLVSTENGAVITNLATGTFDFTNSSAGVRHDGGAYGVFENAGLVRRMGQTTLCSIEEPFLNTGAVECRSGRLRFVRSFVQTAGSTLVAEGRLVAEQGLTLTGGVLSGTNVVSGNVTNNALVQPGPSFGRLTIEGNYVETTNARLQIEIGGPAAGTQHDQLIVTNQARLAGTIEVTVSNGYVPGRGTVITAAVCNLRIGTFRAAAKPDEYYVLYMPKTVLLETENAPPVPRLTVGSHQWACHPFRMQGTATDPDGTVTNIAFLIEGTALAQFPQQSSGTAVGSVDFPGEFLCTLQATDDKGAVGETNVVVTVATLPVHVLDPVGFQTNKAFKLCMCGEPGSNYVVEAVSALGTTNWFTLGPMENTNGIWRFLDTTVTNAPHRFYRARQL